MSTTFNVWRYTALGAGIIYGAYHRYSLESSHAKKEYTKRWNHEEKLIQQAKDEYAKLKEPKTTTQSAPTSIISGSINWEDPNLDLGKALDSVLAQLD
ncbi:TIM11 [Candida pseudojiufengensis]|uniref:TIM11 n=1 Tax=Candida pseudojiufengensis TaxID=497109 RepID=UPI002224A44A|nr:TIM11 [Candida pseudojiufengensis]KAI5959388.1 TIM11 [Candida pseudojiufengensis]